MATGFLLPVVYKARRGATSAPRRRLYVMTRGIFQAACFKAIYLAS